MSDTSNIPEYKFTCRRCGKVWYVPKTYLDGLQNKTKWQKGFALLSAAFNKRQMADSMTYFHNRNVENINSALSCPECGSTNCDAEIAE